MPVSPRRPSPDSRRQLLFGAGLGSLLLPLTACSDLLEGLGWRTDDAPPPEPPPQSSPEEHDIGLLNAGVLLEQTAILAYTAAAGLPFIREDAAVLTVAKLFMSQHEEHRDALAAMVEQFGGTPSDPTTALPPAIPPAILDASLSPDDRKLATLRFARALERQAADTYFQLVVAQLRTDSARRSATEILPVEAQHVAVLDFVLGAAQPVNAAFFTEQT